MHDFTIPAFESKGAIYEAIIPQIEYLFQDGNELISSLSNAVALLKCTALPFFWVGFYIVKDDKLILGPFQGLPATPRIDFGAGVCGACWKEKSTQVVPDVHLFPGHIACNCQSQSEITVPIFSENQVVAVLDIDSNNKGDFDEIDARYLEQLAEIIGKKWRSI